MRLQQLHLRTVHPYCYRPQGCETLTVGSLLWDTDKLRFCVELNYDNGFRDWYPLDELMKTHEKIGYDL